MSVRRLAPADLQPKSFAFTAENVAWAKQQVAYLNVFYGARAAAVQKNARTASVTFARSGRGFQREATARKQQLLHQCNWLHLPLAELHIEGQRYRPATRSRVRPR